MVEREIVLIDEDKCNGCGLCVPACHEGALQIIDGKARLISDLMCDGLGACVGHCPQDAITIEKREAEPYNEVKVLKEFIIPKGGNTLKAHLQHLKEHNEMEYLREAIVYLKENNIELPNLDEGMHHGGGCPGARTIEFNDDEPKGDTSGKRDSELRQWPIQLHLVNPAASYFEGSDVLLSADCVAYALGDYHKDFLKGKRLAIACPKLDSNMEIYQEKLVSLIENSRINTLTTMIMEVPCCSGLSQLAEHAKDIANRKIPIKKIVVSLQGKIISEEWI